MFVSWFFFFVFALSFNSALASSVDHFREMLSVAPLDGIKTFLGLNLDADAPESLLAEYAKKAIAGERFDVLKVLLSEYRLSLDTKLPGSPTNKFKTILEAVQEHSKTDPDAMDILKSDARV